MPLDTSIYGNIRPIEVPSQMDTAGKFLTLQNLLNQGKMQDLQMQTGQVGLQKLMMDAVREKSLTDAINNMTPEQAKDPVFIDNLALTHLRGQDLLKYKAQKLQESRPIPMGRGGALIPDGKGGFTVMQPPETSTTAPHTIVDQNGQVRQWDAATRTYVPAQMSDPGGASAMPQGDNPSVRSNIQPESAGGDMSGSSNPLALIARISDPVERAAAIQAFNRQTPAQPGAPIFTRTPPKSPYTNIKDDPLRPGHFIGFNTQTNKMEPVPTDALLAPKAPVSTDTHGDEFLKSLDPGIATTVKALAEGRIAMPAGFALKSPYWQNILTLVGQYDPEFSASRAAVWKDFTSGQTARNVTSVNMVIAHVGTLSDMVDALQNKDLRVLNALVNRAKVELGKPEVNNFDTAKQAVGAELMRVFRQINASEVETKDWEKRFQSSNSPEQLKGAIKTGVELLKGRIDALDDQWKRAMNKDTGFPNLVSPKSQAVLSKLGLSVTGTPTAPARRATDNAPMVNAKGWPLMTDAKGNKAYVGPNREIEEVR